MHFKSTGPHHMATSFNVNIFQVSVKCDEIKIQAEIKISVIPCCSVSTGTYNHVFMVIYD